MIFPIIHNFLLLFMKSLPVHTHIYIHISMYVCTSVLYNCTCTNIKQIFCYWVKVKNERVRCCVSNTWLWTCKHVHMNMNTWNWNLERGNEFIHSHHSNLIKPVWLLRAANKHSLTLDSIHQASVNLLNRYDYTARALNKRVCEYKCVHLAIFTDTHIRMHIVCAWNMFSLLVWKKVFILLNTCNI